MTANATQSTDDAPAPDFEPNVAAHGAEPVLTGVMADLDRFTSLDAFQQWRATVPQILRGFLATPPQPLTGPLDFSGVSLITLEAWLLGRYPHAAALAADHAPEPNAHLPLVEQLAVYVGETFRQHLGGDWTVLLTEPATAPSQAADLQGVPLVNCPPACCPRQMLFEAVHKRNGFTLRAAFEYFKKRRQREARQAAAAAAAAETPGAVATVESLAHPPAVDLLDAPAASAVPTAASATPAVPQRTLHVYGFRKTPREAVVARLAEIFQLRFDEQDSLTLGLYATAQHETETFRVLNNYNVLENEWFEDVARACAVLLYIDGVQTPARAAALRHTLMEQFPTIEPLRTEPTR